MTKLTRRIRVGVVAFESYGIERGDRAIVAMTGDVSPGELGYFETGHYYGGSGCRRVLQGHSWFAFLCDQDAACHSWIEPGNGICLRSCVDRCEGEHGAEPYDDIPDDASRQPGGVLIDTYGRVVAVERGGEAVESSLTFRALDEREQATTSITRRPAIDWPDTLDPDSLVQAASVPDRLPTPRRQDAPALSNPDKRMAPLTDEQHEEIARLIRSSMDSTAKNPLPALTYQGRIVVRREVTTLARLSGVRRLKSHSATFRRALAAFERKVTAGEAGYKRSGPAFERTGRLAIEHLWRWLHGYTKPLKEWSRKDDWAECVSEAEPPSFDVPPGLLGLDGISNDLGDNLRPTGETLNVNGQQIPILKIRKWIREVHPQTIHLLCVGPPGDPLMWARPHVHALYSTICGERARYFSLEHGGFVCDKHITPEFCLVSMDGDKVDENTYPSSGYWDCTGDGPPRLIDYGILATANSALAMIEEKAYGYWRKDNPDKDRSQGFPQWFREYWDGLARSLTNQVRVSTAPVLWGKGHAWAN